MSLSPWSARSSWSWLRWKLWILCGGRRRLRARFPPQPPVTAVLWKAGESRTVQLPGPAPRRVVIPLLRMHSIFPVTVEEALSRERFLRFDQEVYVLRYVRRLDGVAVYLFETEVEELPAS